MFTKNEGEVLIIGGSYAGLSAAMALGRSLRKVLIIDSGNPCNRQTPHAHNFITQDGQTPAQVAAIARQQVLQYPTIEIVQDKAVSGKRITDGFEIKTGSGATYAGKKILFATGVLDLMPPIEGFAECWGISVLHCPYCHGYEVRNLKIGLIGNGDAAFELCRLIYNWSKNLILFTNGQNSLTEVQLRTIKDHNIEIMETPIAGLQHNNGRVNMVLLKDGTSKDVAAVFARVPFKQHCLIPEEMGCGMTGDGFIKVDELQRTSLPGIYAAGDNTTFFRAVSLAVAAGTKAGAMMNKELIEEAF